VSLVGVGPALMGSLAHAQTTYTWNGGGANDDWTTADNWVGGVAPVSATNNTILFDGTTRLNPNNDFAAGTGFFDLRFGGTAGNFVLSGNSITLGDAGGGSTIFNNAAPAGASITVNNDLIVNELIATFIQTFRNPANTVTLNGVISTASGIGANNAQFYIFQRGLWVLTNSASSFDRGVQIWLGGTVRSAELLDAGTNSTIGAGDRIRLGNATTAGTFEYTGGATETNRQILVGGGTDATHAGGGTFLNNGTGAVTFDNAAFNIATTAAAGRTLTLGGTYAGINTISGVITDNNGATSTVGVTVSGSTWSLDGANTYTGDTTVSGGSLRVNGSTAADSAVSVASGGIIGGTGTIGGATTVSGILAPGSSGIGTLSIANHVTWNGGQNWLFELGTAGASLANPGTSDLLDITAGDFVKGSGPSWTFDFVGTGAQGWYKLATWTGTTGFSADDFTATNLSGANTGTFVIQDSALYIQVVPEPATWALAAVGLACGSWELRRRRRTQRRVV